ncbi:MAG: FAD-binding oxidoreductase [Promethearchaeota archaeon]
MGLENIIKNLQSELPWDMFLSKMEHEGFIKKKSLNFSLISNIDKYRKLFLSGNIMLIGNRIQSGSIRDPSHLHISPYALFRPTTEEQLKKIIVYSQQYKIPITFAGGKTGLSGGYSNFGIVADLADLHSSNEPFQLNFKKEQVSVEQGAIISDLIKAVQFLSNGKYIFPIQPASALKLPVRIGGLISSNASGITSGKLGSVENWVDTMRIMKPDGTVININHKNSLFKRIIGGNGYFGVVLSAVFKLYKPLTNLKRAILYGHEIELAFNGLQSVLDFKIFPLISEFVVSNEKLPGKFSELIVSNEDDIKTKWATIIKGTSSEVDEFIRLMNKETKCSWSVLTEEEFQEYLQERSVFALLVQISETNSDYIAFPSFEDILSEPKNLPVVIETINNIFIKHGFHKVIFGYGHINFRKGQGLLLHMRLPVPIEYFYKNSEKNLTKVGQTVYEVILTLKEKFRVKHKAEHSPGIFPFFLNADFREKFRELVKKGAAFTNPHLMIYDQIVKEEYKNKIEKEDEKQIFIKAMNIYLSNM